TLHLEATNRRVDVVGEGIDVAIRVRPRPIEDSDLVMRVLADGGQIFTNGEFFDTIGLRGVNLSTDDNMFPDGMRSYAPEIRGVAQCASFVTRITT
ncbi:fimbria/pilus outer membrane usher protein, partial [Klebsiella pneumoniae]|uniref:fimbria/pilus outer membrane usher protein n=1 Tax=Klebsiella pneumoniae TaxID=573 RepID=UPI00210DCF34